MTVTPAPGRDRANTHPNIILAIILVSYAMIVLDISVVLTGLPKIQAELGFSPTNLAWVQSAYTLTFGGFLLLGARAGDILGRRRMFIVGLAIFTVASVAIAASPSPEWMLAWRAIQGFGSAILAPSTLALLQTYFPEGPARTRAVSYYSAAAGVAATAGLVVGGLLAGSMSWRAGFYINLPIGVGLILAARHYIAETPRQPGALDVTGAILSTFGISGLVYSFIRSAETGWADLMTLGVLAGAVILLGLFILNERRAAHPILPLRLFADRVRSGAYAARILYLAAMVGFFFFTTLFLQDVRGYGPARAGLAFLPATLLHVPFAIAFPRLARHVSPNRLLIAGLVTGVVALAWLSRATPQSGYLVSIALPMLLIGVSQGLTLSPLTSAGVSGVSETDVGAASGAVNVAHQIGSSVGLSVLVAIAAVGSQGLSGAAETAHHFTLAFEAGTALVVIALVIALTAIVRPKTQESEAGPRAADCAPEIA